jgi:iron complex outermembrane recepter protein
MNSNFTFKAFSAVGIYFLFFNSTHANNIEFDPVIVTASKYEESYQSSSAFVTVITQQDIKESGATTINEAIMRIGGVQGRQSLFGGNEFTLDLLGFGDTASSNTVIVINGIPLKEGDSSETRLSGIPIDQVEKIEIQRGGSSVMYGENAVSGVINIITKSYKFSESNINDANLSLGYGSYRTDEIKVNAIYASNSLSLNYGGLGRQSDGYRVNSNSKNTSDSLSILNKFDGFSAGIDLSSDKVSMQTPGSLTISQFQQNPIQAQAGSFLYKTRMSSNTDRFGTFVDGNLLGFDLKLNISRRVRTVNSLLTITDANSTLGTGYDVGPLALETENNYYGLTAAKFIPTNFGSDRLFLGVENSQWSQQRVGDSIGNSIYGTLDTSSQINSKSNSIYSKNEVYFAGQEIRITSGLRIENVYRNLVNAPNPSFDPNGNNMTVSELMKGWELGFSKAINSSNNLYLRLDNSYRLPNSDEFSNTVANNGGYLYSNTGLASQTSFTKELGWKQKINDKSKLGLRIYRSDLKNEIAYNPQLQENINLDPTQRKGIDLDGFYKFNNIFNFYTVIGLRQAQFKFGQYSGNNLPMAPSKVGTIRLDSKIFDHQKISISLTGISSEYIAGDFANTTSMPGYATSDLRYSIESKDIELNFLVRNLVGKSYYSYATQAFDASYNLYTAVYPDPGRNFMASIKVHF